MKLKVFVPRDMLSELSAREYFKGEKAVTDAMIATSRELKMRWRQQVLAAGLGTKLGNSIRGAAYPVGDLSMNAAALVWTRAPKLIAAYDSGAVIRAANGRYLAIPLPAAGRARGGQKMTPSLWKHRTGLPLRLVKPPGKNPLLVADNMRLSGGKRAPGVAKPNRRKIKPGETIALFVLVPQVSLRKRLDLVSEAEAMAATVPGRIIANWWE